MKPVFVGSNEKTITLFNGVLPSSPIFWNKNYSQTLSAITASSTKHLKGVVQITSSQHHYISTPILVLTHSKSHCTQHHPEIPSRISFQPVVFIQRPCCSMKTLGKFTINTICIFRCTLSPVEKSKCGQSVILSPQIHQHLRYAYAGYFRP